MNDAFERPALSYLFVVFFEVLKSPSLGEHLREALRRCRDVRPGTDRLSGAEDPDQGRGLGRVDGPSM